jgi:hypothetical protein
MGRLGAASTAGCADAGSSRLPRASGIGWRGALAARRTGASRTARGAATALSRRTSGRGTLSGAGSSAGAAFDLVRILATGSVLAAVVVQAY